MIGGGEAARDQAPRRAAFHVYVPDCDAVWQRAIEAGDSRSGVCLMQMEKGLDTGPVLLELRTAIGPEDTGGSLHDRLSLLAAQVLGEGLKLLRAGARPIARAQAANGATYAHKIDKAEAILDWSQPAATLANKVRAFNPWPVCEASVGNERLRVHAARALPMTQHSAPGALLACTRDGIDVACGEGVLRLLRVQRDGGRPISAADYLNARADLRTA